MAVLERLMPKVGDVIRDRYELEAILGEGGFGVVFRARQRGLDSDVAFKVLLPHVLANDDLVRRFEREVSVVKSLRHPNTIRVLDFGQTAEEIPFYVMEFVDGVALEAVLEEGPVAPARARRIVLQLLKSLEEAHQKGIVHRDLKPANIMLTEVVGENDFVKVLDFGIAKALEKDHGGGVTQTGAILGTPAYVSPEQARGQRDIDHRSDIYAVGLILGECVTGKALVSGDSAFDIVAQHARSAPIDLPPVLADSPLRPIIEKATSKNRDERYATAMEMAQVLAEVTELSGDLIFEVSHSGTYTPKRTPGELSNALTQLATPMPTEYEIDTPSGTRLGILIGLLIAGLAVAATVLIMTTNNSGDAAASAAESDRSQEAVAEADVTETVATDEADADEGTGEGPVALVDPDEASAVDRQSWSQALEVAHRGVRTSLPTSRVVRFEGTDQARVSLDGRELGRIPFQLLHPALPAEIELRVERRGYESATTRLSLDDERVHLQLQRRRRHEPEETPEVEDEEEDGSTPSPFEEAPIYD